MFKLPLISSLLAMAALIASCDKRDKLDSPDFSVTTAKSSYKTGDSVVFNFTGSPDVITFYSGESGAEYKYRERTELEGGTTYLSFSTRVLHGSQQNSLSVWASTDFTGYYDTNAVKAANWTDITSRFQLDPSQTGTGAITQSGAANISDLVVSGKPLYIAYRYAADAPTGSAATQRTWRVQSFSLTNSFPNGDVISLASLFTAGWINVDFQNPNNFWKQEVSLGYLQFAPNSSMVASEDWAISKPFHVAQVAPDKGVAIKEYMLRKTEHMYIFNNPGTYKVTFVGANTNADEVKTVVKELDITITN